MTMTSTAIHESKYPPCDDTVYRDRQNTSVGAAVMRC